MQFMLLYRGPAAIVAGQPHAMGIDGALTDIHRAFLLPVNAAVSDAFITVSVLPSIDPHHGLTRDLQPPSPPPGHAAGGRGAYNGLPILEPPPDVDTHASHAWSPLDADEMDVDGAGVGGIGADLKPFHATEVRVAARPWLPLQRLLGGSRGAAAGRGGARATMQVLVPATSQKHLAILRYMSARPCRTRHVRPPRLPVKGIQPDFGSPARAHPSYASVLRRCDAVVFSSSVQGPQYKRPIRKHRQGVLCCFPKQAARGRTEMICHDGAASNASTTQQVGP